MIIGTEQERPEILAAPARRCVADDHELVFLADFDLQPRRGALLDIGRGQVLGHDPFVAFLLRGPVGGEPVLGQAPRQEEALALADRFFERPPADGQWFPAQVAAVLPHHVPVRIEARALIGVVVDDAPRPAGQGAVLKHQRLLK